MCKNFENFYFCLFFRLQKTSLIWISKTAVNQKQLHKFFRERLSRECPILGWNFFQPSICRETWITDTRFRTSAVSTEVFYTWFFHLFRSKLSRRLQDLFFRFSSLSDSPQYFPQYFSHVFFLRIKSPDMRW